MSKKQTKLKTLISLLAIKIAIIALFFGPFFPSNYFRFKNMEQSTKKNYKKFKQEMASTGSGKDPIERVNFERMKLVDPKTGIIPVNIREKEVKFSSLIKSREFLSKHNPAFRTMAQTWTQRGPFNVGGRTRALKVDINNENILLAGGVSGGMWKSLDGGASWSKTTDPGLLQNVTCLTQDTRSGKTTTWYHGTGEYLGNSASGDANSPYHGNGIFKSTDNGTSWTQLSATASLQNSFESNFDYVWNIQIDPSNAGQDEVYAATYGSIQRSVNGGSTWSLALGTTSAPSSTYTDVAVTSTGVVYAALSSDGPAASNGLFRSVDGVTWKEITPPSFPTSFGRISVAQVPTDSKQAYFFVDLGNVTSTDPVALKYNLWHYTYVSGDGSGAGGTWVDKTASLPAFGGSAGDLDTQFGYNMIIKVKPNDANTVLIGGTNLYRSTNGFSSTAATTWVGGYSTANNFSTYTNHHPDQHALDFYPSDPNKILSGHDGGISRTSNISGTTVSWEDLNKGYLTTQFYAVAINPATTDDFIIGGKQDNGTFFTTSNSPTSNWIKIKSGDGGFCAVNNAFTSVYASSQNNDIYRFVFTSNGTQVAFTNVTPSGTSGVLFINPFALDPNNDKMMYAAGGTVMWRNSDLTAITLSSNKSTSTNWTSLSASQITGATITALGISKSTPSNRVYYGTNKGALYRLDNANAASPTRTTITGSGFPANAYVSSISVNPTDANKVMVAFSNYSVVSIFYSTNGGTSWTSVSGNLEQNVDGSGNGPSVRSVNILPLSSCQSIYFAGTSTGLYSTESLNGTSTVWVKEGASNIGNVPVDMITSRSTDKTVAIGTHGNGVYSTKITNFIANSITLKGNATFCSGDSTILEAVVGAGITYQWKKDGVTIPSAINKTYTVKQSGVYTVDVTGGSCPGTSDAREITVNPLPAKPTISTTGNATSFFFTLTSSLDSGNQWIKDGQQITGATGKTYNVTSSGSYSVKSISNLGCQGPVSAALAVTSDGNSLIVKDNIRVYPSPFTNTLIVESSFASSANSSISLFSINGRKIRDFKPDTSQNKTYLNTTDIPNGIYLLTVINGMKIYTQKVIKKF